MARFIFTSDQERYFLENWTTQSCKEMGEKFGIAGAVVQRFLKRNGIVIPKQLSYKIRAKKLIGRTVVTPGQDEQIKALYLTMPVKTLARHLGIGDTALIKRLKTLDLVIPRHIIEQRKKDSQLKHGNIPVNKGLKQTEYMSPEAIERTKRTRFKKGDIPHNAYNEIGKIVIRQKKDGSERYKYICLAVGKWMLYHQYIWRKYHGDIPSGMVIRFKDGDSMNCEISNLECVTLAENLRLNNLTDNAIATRLSFSGRGKVDQDMKNLILENYPQLIEIRRQEILLRKELRDI